MRKGYYFNWWAEALTLLMLVVGYFVGTGMRNSLVAIAVSIIAGILFGRFTFAEHEDHFVPALIVSAGFIIGFAIGNKFSSDMSLLSLFVVALFVSFYIHREGFLDKLT